MQCMLHIRMQTVNFSSHFIWQNCILQTVSFLETDWMEKSRNLASSLLLSDCTDRQFLFRFTHCTNRWDGREKVLSNAIWSQRYAFQFFIKSIHCKCLQFLLLIFSLVNWKIWDFYIWCDINIRSLLLLTTLCTIHDVDEHIATA